jgi:hypothetical protein
MPIFNVLLLLSKSNTSLYTITQIRNCIRGRNNMKKHILVICISILFLISALIPITLGHDIKSPEVNQLKPIKNRIDSPPEEEWNKTFGGTSNDIFRSVRQINDGGYILIGTTWSFGAGSGDVWLIKTDASGTIQWNRTYGGTNYDSGYCVLGYGDVWLIKTDSYGNIQWDKTFGTFWGIEHGNSVRQTSDGGYIITGSYKDNNMLCSDIWLIKTDATGNMQWNRTFGGTKWEYSESVRQTNDGGYIIAGETMSFGDGEHYDVWLIKTDYNGNMLWNKTFGGTEHDAGSSVQQTTDGGYILAGRTESFSVSFLDVWLIKTDSNGNMQWNKTFGGYFLYTAYDDSVQQTTDGDYLISATGSFDNEPNDVWLIKTNSSGNIKWIKNFGGPSSDAGYSVQQTKDGGYIITGLTYSFGAGYEDGWLIKVAKENHPPNTPVIEGPISGNPKTKYDFSFNATDPEGDAVMYNIDWGDGDTDWTEYGDSGVEIILKHTWEASGKYTIKAQTIDIHGAESDWTEFPITMPRDKATNYRLLQNSVELITFIDAFAYEFKIERIGLGVHIEIWGVDRTIDLEGYRYPIFPFGQSNFVVSTDHVIAPRFIGIWYPITVDTYGVKGFALGNVEWD